jgi:hypothetical protein
MVRATCGFVVGLVAGVLLAPGTQVRLHRFFDVGDGSSSDKLW